MKKINVKDYFLEVSTNEGTKKFPYNVMTSIENIVCASGQATSQRLTPSELLERYRILTKMRNNIDKDGNVILEDSEYNIIKKGFDAFSGVGINEVELCKRVYEVEDIKSEDIQVKKKNKK